MTTKQPFDLVIIGGGLAGATLALALANQPLKIAVVEAKDEIAPHSSPDERALALTFASALIFKHLNLWPAISAKATPIHRVHVSDTQHFHQVRMTAAELNTPALGYVTLAQTLLTTLQTQARQNPNITWICPAQLQHVERRNTGYDLQLSTAHGNHSLHARLLIAADGSDSVTRRCLGINITQQESTQMALTCRVKAAEHHGIAFERFSASSILAALPLANQERVVIWTLPEREAKQLLQLDAGDFQKKLQHAWGYRLGRISEVFSRRAFPLHSMQANQTVLPGAVLLGNAAHTLHPVAAQGFNLTLGDIATLAEVITDALATGKNPGDLSVLEVYQQRRHLEQKQLKWGTDGLVTLFSSTLFPAIVSRNIGLFGLTMLPPLRRAFAKKAMGLLGRLPKLVSGTPLTS